MTDTVVAGVLNVELYQRLRRRFNSVLIANEGSPMYGSRVRDAIDPRRTRVHAYSWGEYYRICCPFCLETRHRLWINYMYGQANDFTGHPETWLAICYNENCLASPARRWQLKDMIFGMQTRRDRMRTQAVSLAVQAPQVLSTATPPGEILRLTELPAGHPGLQYCHQRRFDPLHLSQCYQVGFCLSVASPDWSPMRGRLYIPIFMRGELVGWQGRYLGELNWKTAGIPKYYGRAGMAKKLMLYNFDVAKDYPFVLVVEGATSVWRLGGPAVAILGKTLSGPQQMLLRQTWANKPVVLMLDPDARDDMEGILHELTISHSAPVLPIYLPVGYDPADYERDVGVRMVLAAGQRAGVTLPAW